MLTQDISNSLIRLSNDLIGLQEYAQSVASVHFRKSLLIHKQAFNLYNQFHLQNIVNLWVLVKRCQRSAGFGSLPAAILLAVLIQLSRNISSDLILLYVANEIHVYLIFEIHSFLIGTKAIYTHIC
jgi:flagellar biosynthesis component FlhA